MEYEVDIIELKKLMIEKGYSTIGDLSDASGVDRNTTSEVINGKKYPSSMVMSKLGTALEMNSGQMGSIFFKVKLA
jgi:hypothetical protein